MEERSDRLAQIRAITYKRRDSWWTVLLVDPLAIHLVRLADRLRWVTPNRITTLAFLSGLGAASAFLAAAFRPGETLWLIVGAVAYHLAFTFDCVDGKLARWQRRSSPVGGWLDFSLDQIRVVMCALALLGGQYKATGQASFTLVATAVVALHMFRYLNGSLMERALFELRGPPATHRPPTVDDTDDLPLTLPEPTSGTAEAAHPGPTEPELGRPSAVDPQPAGGAAGGGTGVGVGGASGAGGLVSGVARWEWWLQRRRIRLNVYGGVEFQMAVLIGAPVAGAIAGSFGASISRTMWNVTVVACALMLAAESAQVIRFLRAAGHPQRRATAASLPVAALPAAALPAAALPAAGTDGDVPVQRPAIATDPDRPQR